MTYFLYNSETDEEVADEPVTRQKALEEFYELPDEPDSFFGLENDAHTIIQFVWDSDDQWLIDMPNGAKSAYQGYGNFDKCSAVIEAFLEGSDVAQLFSLKYVDLR